VAEGGGDLVSSMAKRLRQLELVVSTVQRELEEKVSALRKHGVCAGTVGGWDG